jgi:hypothetical protein
MEGDEAEKNAPVASYVPPRADAKDSLASRIAALTGQAQFVLLSQRGIENRAWDEIAAEAGQPLNTIGQTLVRTVDRMSRFFGAPPPLNQDLEPVFSWIVRQNASAKHSSTQKAKGRITAMQLDPSFYAVKPEMRRIGLSVPSEVRTMVLWDAARASSPPGEALRDHLAQCHYCADLLRALLLMQQALQSDHSAEFLLCPGGFTLLKSAEDGDEPVERHVAECLLCREERARALGDAERDAAGEPGTVANRKIAWAAAGVVLLAVAGYFVQHQYFAAKSPEAPRGELVFEKTAPVLEVNARYKDLAQLIDIKDLKWIETALPENRQNITMSLDRLQSGNLVDAKFLLSGMMKTDPIAAMLYGFVLSHESQSDGYAVMRQAEAMPPRSSFRCWATLQAALKVGDKATIDRELQHLSSDPEYAARARDILAKVRARG